MIFGMVIGPNEASDVLPRGVLAFSADEEREIFGIGEGNGSLKITAHEGIHVRKRKTPMRVYEVVLDRDTSFVHSGDHDFSKAPMEFHSKPDLLIASVEDFPESGVGKDVQKVLLTHTAELGHTNDLGRFGFAEAYTRGQKAGVKTLSLTWGESITI